MKHRQLGTSDLRISPVGMGTWAIGNDFWGKVDDQESVRAIQAGIDAGITFIDTAPAYGAGHSEEIVGRAVKGRRDEVVIGTKVGIIRTEDDFVRNLKAESVLQEIDDSLRRLGVDVIDLYQIHWPDPNTPIEETMTALNKAQEAGKFRYLGVSNFNIAQMEEIRQYGDIVSLQPQFSLLKRDIEGEVIQYCLDNGIGIVNYGTLAGGILTGKFREIPEFEEGDNRAHFYPWFNKNVWGNIQSLLEVLRGIADERGVTAGQVAINWTIRQAGITSALVGAKNPDQARGNAGGGDFELTQKELNRIDEAYKKNVAGIL
ncbi:MAG: aldo/keto reductase [Spirochaetales bacterium]|nr:aldo/keto reductase [Spirochaetales bacterium]MCF7939614.1 aldo/keto reductase [Spirochaetales bacterium]